MLEFATSTTMVSSIPPNPPTVDRLCRLIESFRGQRVLMLVDLVLDRFITGIPKRISREAPVLILSFESEKLVPGGGANAVANVQALGGEPLTVGVVGDDDSGRCLLAELGRRGIAVDDVLISPGYRTPTKTRILGGGRHAIKQQIVRYDVEQLLELSAEQRRQLASRVQRLAGQAGAAVLSDYGYGTVEPESLADIRRSLAPGGVVLCDSRYRLAELRGMDGATPNEEEADTLFGGRIGSAESLESDSLRVESAGRQLLERLEARFLLITRGSRGMVLVESGGAVHLPVHGTDQVADVTGAGDTVIATFALATAAGATPLEAALLANYAGGVVVMKMGTATLSREELRGAVLSNPSLLEELRWAKS